VVLFGATYPLALLDRAFRRGLPCDAAHGWYWLSLAPGTHADATRHRRGDAIPVLCSAFIAHRAHQVPAQVPVSVLYLGGRPTVHPEPYRGPRTAHRLEDGPWSWREPVVKRRGRHIDRRAPGVRAESRGRAS
jgi:hypothetical protein